MAGKIPESATSKVVDSSKVPESATSNVKDSKTVPKNAVANVKVKDSWNFSFSYWNQDKYFGLNYQNVNKNWFVTLLERLKDLSNKSIEDVTKGHANRDFYHFHVIDWDKSSINESDFNKCIPTDYQGEQTEITQIFIDKSKGRIVGFMDANSVYQIVFLDPAHNMQLCSYNEYTIRKTAILPSCYAKHQNKFVGILDKSKTLQTGQVESLIEEIQGILNNEGYDTESRFVTIPEVHFEKIDKILEKVQHYDSLDYLIMDALDALEQKHEKELAEKKAAECEELSDEWITEDLKPLIEDDGDGK